MFVVFLHLFLDTYVIYLYICSFLQMYVLMKDRIQVIMDYYKLSKAEFGERIGVQTSAVHHLLSGRNEPSTRVLKSILENFPEIDMNWFIFGNGDMLKNNVQTPRTETFIPQKGPSQLQMPDLFSNNVADLPKKTTQPTIKIEQTAAPVKTESAEQRVQTKQPAVPNTQAVYPAAMETKSELRSVKKITIYYTDGTYEEYDVSPRL